MHSESPSQPPSPSSLLLKPRCLLQDSPGSPHVVTIPRARLQAAPGVCGKAPGFGAPLLAGAPFAPCQEDRAASPLCFWWQPTGNSEIERPLCTWSGDSTGPAPQPSTFRAGVSWVFPRRLKLLSAENRLQSVNWHTARAGTWSLDTGPLLCAPHLV